MALSLRGSATGHGESAAAVTVNLPGGTTTDDVVIVGWSVESTSDLNLSLTTSGYTELADLYADDTDDTNLGVYRKIMGGTPDSTVVGPNVGNGSKAMVVHVWTGADTTTPEDATTTTATGIDTQYPDPASITTATDNAVVVVVAGNPSQDDTVTAPSGYTNSIAVASTTGGADCSAYMASKAVASAGAENPGAWGAMGGADATWCWAAATVAIRPAAAAAAPDFGWFTPLTIAPSGMAMIGY